MRIVWLCYFANQEMKDYFNTPKIIEFAPWIRNYINLFRDNNAIELHIVAPNVYTNKDKFFKKNGITYHFYKYVPILSNNKFIIKVYSLLSIEHKTKYFWIKQKIENIINNIHPDIVHLHGAENSYYSAGILPILAKYPVITTIQGFVRNASESDSITKHRIQIEEEIIQKCVHFGTRTEEMNKIILGINPNANLHFHNNPLEIPSEIKNNIGNSEPIDCLFFARICKDKGIEDLIHAISILKKELPEISLSVIGTASKKYLVYLKKLCSELDLEKNITFLGNYSQSELYKYALQAKLCVLPTYHDSIPGTIIESMCMKLPVVAYAVGGIPELNKCGINVMLVEKHNIDMLAESILHLLRNSLLRKTIAENAFETAHKKFNNNNLVNDILNAYESMIEDH